MIDAATSRAWDLAEAVVLADAVGDTDRADRYLDELRAIVAAARPTVPGDPATHLIAAVVEDLSACGEVRIDRPLAGLIPGPAMAATDLGLTPDLEPTGQAPALRGADRVHTLKVWPQFWPALATGAKPFEVRRDDGRGFRVGDVLHLAEVEQGGRWTGRRLERRITYVATADDLARIGLHYLAPGTVVLGLSRRAL